MGSKRIPAATRRWFEGSEMLDRALAVWAVLLSPKAESDLRDLVPGGDLAGLPSVDDLRANGLHVHRPERLAIEGRQMIGLDLAGARLNDVKWKDVSFTDCDFDGAEMSRSSFFGCELVRSTFRRARLDGSTLGHRDGGRSRFAGCDFSGSHWKAVRCVGAVFTKCSFEQVQWRKLDFPCTRFEDCTFSGTFDDVSFYASGIDCADLEPNSMKGCDLHGAKLHYVDFRLIDLIAAILPDDADHLVLEPYRETFIRAVESLPSASLAGVDRERAAREFHDRLKRATSDQRRGVIALREWRDEYGDRGAKSLEGWLRELAARSVTGKA